MCFLNFFITYAGDFRTFYHDDLVFLYFSLSLSPHEVLVSSIDQGFCNRNIFFNGEIENDLFTLEIAVIGKEDITGFISVSSSFKICENSNITPTLLSQTALVIKSKLV